MKPADMIKASPLHAMEAAIEARLRLAFPPAFTITQLPANASRRDFETVLNMTPVLAVSFTGAKAQPATARCLSCTVSWSVIIIVKNNTGAPARLRGDNLGPGAYGMLSVAAAMLHGFTVPGLGSVSVTGMAPLAIADWSLEGMLPMSLDLEFTGISLAAPFGDNEISDFIKISAAWEFEPAAGGKIERNWIIEPQETA